MQELEVEKKHLKETIEKFNDVMEDVSLLLKALPEKIYIIMI